MRHRIPEPDPDGFVNPGGPRFAPDHRLLNFVQFFRQRQAGLNLQSSGRDQSPERLLREILRAAPAITRPLIDRRRSLIVNRTKRQFVEPSRYVPVAVDVARRLARPERDAQHPVLVQRHGPGQSGHLAVIDDFQRNAIPGLFDFQEQILDSLLKQLLRNATKQRRHLHPIVHAHSR